MKEKENAPVERDVDKDLEGILRANFSEDELCIDSLAKADQSLEERKKGAIRDVAGYFERINRRLNS